MYPLCHSTTQPLPRCQTHQAWAIPFTQSPSILSKKSHWIGLDLLFFVVVYVFPSTFFPWQAIARTSSWIGNFLKVKRNQSTFFSSGISWAGLRDGCAHSLLSQLHFIIPTRPRIPNSPREAIHPQAYTSDTPHSIITMPAIRSSATATRAPRKVSHDHVSNIIATILMLSLFSFCCY